MTLRALLILGVCLAGLLGAALPVGSHAQTPTVGVGCPTGVQASLPEQDCPGARWITQTSTRIDVSRVTGPGCLTNELPPAHQTCLMTGERRTVWYLLTIHAAPGGVTTPGAQAGMLRFVITPADVQTRLSGDSGTTMQGWTDYDFALFRVETQGTRGEACDAVRRAQATGTPGSRQVACNYSGLPGPTGLWDAGTGYAVDDNRFCRPIPVRVGETYILAIDNFSLDASWFTLDFDPTIPAGAPSGGNARVVPGSPLQAGPAQIAATRTPCGLAARVILPAAVECTDLSTWRPGLVPPGQDTIWATSWEPAAPVDVTGESAEWLARFSGPLPATGQVDWVWGGAIPMDRYGRRLTITGPALRIDLSRLGGLVVPGQACAGQSLTVLVEGTVPVTMAQWAWGIDGQGTLEKATAQSATVLLPSPTAGGDRVRIYLTRQEGGCRDTLWASVTVLPLPAAPTLHQVSSDTLEALAGQPAHQLLWQVGQEPEPTPGASRRGGLRPTEYRVWTQDANGCRSAEPARLTPTLTQLRRLGQAEVTLWPQPTTGVVNIRLTGHTGPVSLTLMTLEGRVLSRRAARPRTIGDEALQVDLTDKPAGAYLLLIEGEGLRWQHRVIRR